MIGRGRALETGKPIGGRRRDLSPRRTAEVPAALPSLTVAPPVVDVYLSPLLPPLLVRRARGHPPAAMSALGPRGSRRPLD